MGLSPWFLGHLFPASAWIFLGAYTYVQSCSFATCTDKFRTQNFWILFRSHCLAIAAVIGFAGEIIAPILGGSTDWYLDHNIRGHLFIWLGFGLFMVIEIMHAKNILLGPVWCMLPSLGLSYISLMFMFHHQPTIYWLYLHKVSGLGMIPIVFIYWFWMACGLYYKTSREEREKKFARPGELCPTYTNLAVYETPFPGLVSFFSLLQGMFWFEMWWNMGWVSPAGPFPKELPSPEHAMLETLVKDIVIVVIIMASLNYMVRRVESENAHKRERDLASERIHL